MGKAQEEANQLRQESKELLSKQLLAAMNIHNVETDNFYLGAVDRIVDCIISAAVLEASVKMTADFLEDIERRNRHPLP